jgi:hypothetical protein
MCYRQKKTGRPVTFEITEQTRQAVDEYVGLKKRKSGDFLFKGHVGNDGHLSTRQYSRLVSKWAEMVGLDPTLYGTHSIRRTKATLTYRKWETSDPFNCCSGVQKSRVQFVISASKWMMLLRSLNRLIFEREGPDRALCPIRLKKNLSMNEFKDGVIDGYVASHFRKVGDKAQKTYMKRRAGILGFK